MRSIWSMPYAHGYTAVSGSSLSSPVVAGGDHEQRLGVARDHVVLGLGESRRPEARVDHSDAAVAGPVERGDDVADRARSGLVERSQRQRRERPAPRRRCPRRCRARRRSSRRRACRGRPRSAGRRRPRRSPSRRATCAYEVRMRGVDAAVDDGDGATGARAAAPTPPVASLPKIASHPPSRHGCSAPNWLARGPGRQRLDRPVALGVDDVRIGVQRRAARRRRRPGAAATTSVRGSGRASTKRTSASARMSRALGGGQAGLALDDDLGRRCSPRRSPEAGRA